MSEDVLDRPEVDALYELDPSEFTAARDAVAKELRASGEKEPAAIVKALRKPTKAAWAINRVARARPEEIAALLAAGAELRARQAEALSGGDAGALRAATSARRDVVRSLVAEVVRAGGDASREPAMATLEAASIDPTVGAVVAAGRLAAVVDRPSDMGFDDMPDPPPRARPHTTTRRGPAGRGRRDDPPPPVRIDRKRVERLERTVTTAERDAGAADDDVADAERRLRRAEEALGAAAAKRDDAASALEAARRRQTDAEATLEQARAALAAAENPS